MANIGIDVFDGFRKARLEALTSLDDWADRLSYLYSVLILSVSITIVSLKTYYFNPLVCYLPTKPGGSAFSSFFTESCLIEGTIAVPANSSIPSTEQEWSELESLKRTNYYYWIPFMLGIQLMLFYIPHFIWVSLTHNRLGTDLANLLNQAQHARKASNPRDKERLTQEIAENMSMLFQTHGNINKNWLTGMRSKFGNCFGILLCSKRLGTWTVASYLFVKLLYLGNAIGQLFLMKKFLNFGDGIHSFGIELALRINLVDHWETSTYFPRTSVCRVTARMMGSSSTNFIGICALPINLFNEKIYVFLWFWVIYVAICTAISIPMWLYNSGSSSRRKNRILNYFLLEKVKLEPVSEPSNDITDKALAEKLKLEYENYVMKKNFLESHYPTDDKEIERFIDNYLRADGVFILDMIDQHVGDIVTGEITRYLYLNYLDYFEFDFGMDDMFSEEISTRYSKEPSEGSTLPKNEKDALRTDEV